VCLDLSDVVDLAVCEGSGIEFLPLAADTFGGFGVQAEVALHEVSEDALLLRGLSAPPAIHLHRRLQTALLRGVARQLLRRITHHELEDEDGDGCADISVSLARVPLFWVRTHIKQEAKVSP